MDIDAYLRRIGLDERPPANLSGLKALHAAHLRAIPYENLDVQFGRPVTIERPAIFEKIVGRHRGGWCYEMNGLFGWALDALGFKVTRATGAVMREMFGDPTLRNHLVLGAGRGPLSRRCRLRRRPGRADPHCRRSVHVRRIAVRGHKGR